MSARRHRVSRHRRDRVREAGESLKATGTSIF